MPGQRRLVPFPAGAGSALPSPDREPGARGGLLRRLLARRRQPPRRRRLTEQRRPHGVGDGAAVGAARPGAGLLRPRRVPCAAQVRRRLKRCRHLLWTARQICLELIQRRFLLVQPHSWFQAVWVRFHVPIFLAVFDPFAQPAGATK